LPELVQPIEETIYRCRRHAHEFGRLRVDLISQVYQHGDRRIVSGVVSRGTST
jgi:hypothetical protein